MHYSSFLHDHQRALAKAMARRGMQPAEIRRQLQAKSEFTGETSPVAVSEDEIKVLVEEIRELLRQAASVRARNTEPAGFIRGEPVLLSLNLDADDDGKPVWIQLAKPGTFKGHPSGKPFTLDRGVFEQAIKNFRGNRDGRLPVDFEHASEQAATEGSIPTSGAPAQGWIVDLAIRPDGNLWALVEWGELAQQYIREGKYRYISPAIHLRMKDRVSGQEIGAYISSAGLTNQPFLDGMQPLAASMKSHTALTSKLMSEKGLGYRAAADEAARMIRAELGGT
jgi:hypothetical protein